MDAGKLIGRGISFPPRVGPDGRIAWSEGEQQRARGDPGHPATEPRERLLLPEFGAGLGRYLFEPNTVDHAAPDRGAASPRRWREWEPRIAVESVERRRGPGRRRRRPSPPSPTGSSPPRRASGVSLTVTLAG